MKISVITICKNAEEVIEHTIKSIVSQTYKNLEYIVVDGKSTDNTLAIVRKYKQKISLLISEKDAGIYQAMNKGISAATGDIIIFMNAGDIFYDSSIVKKIAREFSLQNIDLLYGDLIIVEPIKEKRKYKKYNLVDKPFLHNDSLPHQGTACHIRLFKKYGLFDETFKTAGDYEWILRILLTKKIRLFYLNLPIAIFEWGGISNSKKYAQIQKQECTKIVNTYFNPIENILYKNKILIVIRHFPILNKFLSQKMKWNLFQRNS